MPTTPFGKAMQNREATPETITDDVVTFAADLGASSPTFVPLRVPSDAADIGREQNLFRQCRAYKGSPLFGRTIRLAEDLYAVGEFHCVVATSIGLIDVTPGTVGDLVALAWPVAVHATNSAKTSCAGTEVILILVSLS